MIPVRPTRPGPSSPASSWPAPPEHGPPIPLPRLGGRPGGQPQPAGRARPGGDRPPAVRAIIGDLLRQPALYCQSGECITRYSHPAALGERDVRGRAVADGWRHDALGRLICPGCQQRYPFWATRPVARRAPARRS